MLLPRPIICVKIISSSYDGGEGGKEGSTGAVLVTIM